MSLGNSNLACVHENQRNDLDFCSNLRLQALIGFGN